MMRVAILTGGSTAERDVAFAGSSQVVAALRQRGHQVGVVDTATGVLSPADEQRYLVPRVGTTPPTVEELAALAETELRAGLVELPVVRDADVVFLVLHGHQGEGGEMQALLDLSGIPYTGTGPLGSALGMDKDIAKRLFRAAGIPTPDWRMWPSPPDQVAMLGLPLVVKPSKVGSTVGLTVVQSAQDLDRAVATAQQFDDEVLLEQFIPGREFTVGVLGDRALAVGEIEPRHEIFDYECKYTPGMSVETFPARIDDRVARRIQELALAAHRTLKLRDFSRIDFRLAADGTPYCLEANTLPGLTATSLFPQSAAAVGIEFAALCETLCQMVLRRVRRGNKVGA